MMSCRRGGGGVRVRMTNNVEGCIKKHDGGGGEMPENSMTSFMDGPIYLMYLSNVTFQYNINIILTIDQIFIDLLWSSQEGVEGDKRRNGFMEN